jgi:beta-lactamase regulating signal transducer with metallopeptidase domain/thiol-disulfide isomerase/thioredoxin
MTNALFLIGWNQLIAALAAVAVWLLCRTRMLQKQPALCHALWLLVLVKLATPSLVSVPLLPAASSPESPVATIAHDSAAAVEDLPSTIDQVATTDTEVAAETSRRQPDGAVAVASEQVSRADASRQTPAWTLREVFLGLLTASLLGTGVLWLAALRQARSVGRLLRNGVAPSGREAELLRSVSLRFKMRWAVDLRIVDASITPMLWAQGGGAAIILPRKLVDSLDDDQVRNILAHELAHYVRGDRWVHAFSLAVATLFWWNPLAWFARRQLMAAAETCCDALALERSGGSRKSYANTLLAVVDFVGSGTLPRPALCVSFGESGSLRKRFEVLADSSVTSRVSRAGWVMVSLGVAASVLVPARAQEKTTPPAVPPVAQAEPVQDPPDRDPKCYVTGIVFEKGTKKPIADARVDVFPGSEPDPKRRIGITDADGRYRVEVPLGSFRIWFPRLKPGYCLDHADNTAQLITTPAEPILTHDIAANRGTAWPVRIVVDGGIPEGAELTASVHEVEDDTVRRNWLAGKFVTFKKPLEGAISELAPDGIGAFTQCGKSGKLLVGIGGRTIENVMAELIVEPGFDINKVKSIAPVNGTDKVMMTDAAGATATIGKAEVTMQDGLPLLTFRLARRSPAAVQQFAGQVVDADGKPLEGVRVGAAISSAGEGGSVTDRVATTGNDGRFVLSTTTHESKNTRKLSLVITKDGYASFDSPRIDFPAKPSVAINAGKFTLQAGCAIPVRTVDENGNPLAGAVVEPLGDYAQRRQAIRTNAQGLGVLRNLPAGVVPVRAEYGTRSHQSKLVVDEASVASEPITLNLEELNPQPVQEKTFPDPPPVGSAAPELQVVAWTDGQPRTLADYRGKVVVLEFWGVWCSACLNGLPARKEIEARYANRADVVFLGIHSAGTDLAQVKRLLQLKDWKLVTGLDQGEDTADGVMAQAYGARGWPTTVIIDREGKIAYNSNLEKWDSLKVLRERARVAKALNLPPEKSGAAFEERVARTNSVNVFRMSELIDRALEQK